MPRRERSDRRPALLDAATEAIRRFGPSASMTQIAAQAGVTKPILYRHFGSKRGLVHALADRFADDLMRELSVPLQSGAEPREIIVGTIDAYVAFIERDLDVYRFLIQQVDRDTSLIGFMQRIGQLVAVVVGEQLRAAGQDSGGAEPIAHGIVGMVHAAGHWWVEHQSMPRARLVEYIADLLWSGASAFVPTGSTV